jgi:hypothetical protein
MLPARQMKKGLWKHQAQHYHQIAHESQLLLKTEINGLSSLATATWGGHLGIDADVHLLSSILTISGGITKRSFFSVKR